VVCGAVLVAGDDVELPANAPATPAPASSAKVAMVMISFLGFILGVFSFRERACLLAIPFRQKARRILDPIGDGSLAIRVRVPSRAWRPCQRCGIWLRRHQALLVRFRSLLAEGHQADSRAGRDSRVGCPSP